jgi:thymidylate kinase
VREAYRAEIARYASGGMRIVTIDASRSVEEVGREILGAVGVALGLYLR